MGVLIENKSGYVADYYKQKRAAEREVGRKLSNAEFERDHLVTGGVVLER
ncbi:hypothetical protein [Adlercreutzia caecimuris]|nr:hypothetical protein [Adlercreutzia caecimuris]